MNDLQIFNNEELGLRVRTIMNDELDAEHKYPNGDSGYERNTGLTTKRRRRYE